MGKVVYFNSNEYHGSQFVTDEAISAGYLNEFVPRDPMLLTRGINAMIEVRAEKVLESTEDELLRFLVNFPTTRKSLQNLMDISKMSGSQRHITWTSQDKAWLFDRLLSDDPALKMMGRGNLTSLYAYLAYQDGSFLDAPPLVDSKSDRRTMSNESVLEHDDDNNLSRSHDIKSSATNIVIAEQSTMRVPVNAESTLRIIDADGDEPTPQNRGGKLHDLFREFSAEEIDLASMTDDKAILRVQETFYTMVWSSSILGMSQKLQEMAVVATTSLPTSRSDGYEGSMIDVLPNTDLPRHDALDTYQSLRTEIHNAAERIQSISSARRALTSHLVQEATPDEVRLSTKWMKDYKILSAQLTEHMRDIDRWSIPDNQDISDDETYETILERTFDEWGDLYEDDRLWSPDDITRAHLPIDDDSNSVANDKNEESIGAFTERINEEWGWLEESWLVSPQSHSKLGPYKFNEQDWDG